MTFNRETILKAHGEVLRQAFLDVCGRTSAELIAWSIMPEHFHLILELGKLDISRTMKSIKETFAFRYRSLCGIRSGRVWQHRFWDHVIRDQVDYNKHVDYIHFNPVRHGLVSSPGEYELTSFPDFFKSGFYNSDWGVVEAPKFEGEFGE